MNDESKELYSKMLDMELHEVMGLNQNNTKSVIRVPNGFIYNFYGETGDGGYNIATQFVSICPHYSL